LHKFLVGALAVAITDLPLDGLGDGDPLNVG
jgi:hypothetical protein